MNKANGKNSNGNTASLVFRAKAKVNVINGTGKNNSGKNVVLNMNKANGKNSNGNIAVLNKAKVNVKNMNMNKVKVNVKNMNMN